MYRHLILISMESFRGDIFEFPGLKIPYFTKLAQEGHLFTQCHGAAVATMPAQATLLTGVYPPRNGLRLHFPGVLRAEVSTIFGMLKSHGFYSVARVDFANDLRSALLLESVDQITKRDRTALDQLQVERKRGKRTLLFLQLKDLHLEKARHEPSGKALRSYLKRVEKFDRGRLKRLLRGFEERKLLEDTALLIVGAHGEGEILDKTFGHGEVVTEALIRVPWIVWTSDAKLRRGVSEQAVSIVDVAPTALGLLGIRSSFKTADGSDRSPFLLRKKNSFAESLCYAESWRYSPRYFQFLASLSAVGETWSGTWEDLRKCARLRQQTVRAGRYKLVKSYDDGRPRLALYDLFQDPGEKTDVLQTNAGKERMRRTVKMLLQRLRKAAALQNGVYKQRKTPLQKSFFPMHFLSLR